MIRTYLDTGVRIAAWRGTEEVANKVIIVHDMDREFTFSGMPPVSLKLKAYFATEPCRNSS